MFIDEIKIKLKAGRGGDGVVRFRHEKYKEFSGPSGGDGGKGGNVYIQAVRDIGRLSHYRNLKEMKAQKGEDGKRNSMKGRDGDDLVVELPMGSVVTNLLNEKKYRLENEGERILILKGGGGGFGNEHFKSSTNQAPKEWTPGKDAEQALFLIELELYADAGLIGLPSAGKSSLLNALTNANAKVGAYDFTTLEPNLGDLYGFVVADIPGLIEGASEGKGLGHKFLKHIRKTKFLVHLVPADSKDILKDYKTIRNELKKFDPELLDKKEIILISKSDMADEKILKSYQKKFQKLVDDVFTVSILDDDAVKSFKDDLIKILRK